MPATRRPRSPRTAPRPRPLLAGPGGPQAAVAPLQARRCAVCGSDRAWFGFGHPLVPPHRPTVYACREHRLQVDEELVGVPDWLLT
jgi:hypothetical protein